MFALACLTRYEAWPVTVSALAAAAWAIWRGGEPLPSAVRRVGAVALYPAIALVGFAVFSRVVVGEWTVSADAARARQSKGGREIVTLPPKKTDSAKRAP